MDDPSSSISSDLAKCRDKLLAILPKDQWIHIPSSRTRRVANTVHSLHEFLFMDDKIDCWYALQGTAVLKPLKMRKDGSLRPSWDDNKESWQLFLKQPKVLIDKFQTQMYIMIPGEDREGINITVTDVDHSSLYESEEVYQDHSLLEAAERLKTLIVRPPPPDPSSQPARAVDETVTETVSAEISQTNHSHDAMPVPMVHTVNREHAENTDATSPVPADVRRVSCSPQTSLASSAPENAVASEEGQLDPTAANSGGVQLSTTPMLDKIGITDDFGKVTMLMKECCSVWWEKQRAKNKTRGGAIALEFIAPGNHIKCCVLVSSHPQSIAGTGRNKFN